MGFDYRDFLREEFERRCNKNTHYSLRAFARDLGVAPSLLSENLNHKRGLSRSTANQISTKLGLTQIEYKLFTLGVEAEHGRTPRTRAIAHKKIKEIFQDNRLTLSLSEDAFRVISDWYNYALLELVELPDFKNEIVWIAKRLGISQSIAKIAMERLLNLGLLKSNSNGTLSTSDRFTTILSNAPSRSIKKYHSQILRLAESSLYQDPIDERDFSSITFTIDSRKMDEARNLIKEFRRRFAEQMTNSQQNDSIYNLSIQFFRIDQKTIESKQDNTKRRK
jgi:uncharacterized protein (TIGR02147 family)